MKIKCKYFYNPLQKKIIENCTIYWDRNNQKIQLTENSNYSKLNLNYVIPAFRDSHVHLFLSGVKNFKIREKELSCSLSESIENVLSNIQKLKNAGIYEIMDAGDHKCSALKVRDIKDFDDFKIKSCGKALFKKGRYGSFIGLEISDKKSLKNALNILKSAKVDFIKVLNSGINSIKEFGKETLPQFSESEMDYIVKFAKDNNLDVIVHVNGKQSIEQTIKHDIARLEHAFFIKDEHLIKDIAQKGISIVPTFRAMYNLIENENLSNKEREIIKKTVETHVEEIKKFIKYGGKLQLGTDSGSYNVVHGKSFFDEIEFFIKNLDFSFEKILSIVCTLESPVILELNEFSFNSIKNCKKIVLT